MLFPRAFSLVAFVLPLAQGFQMSFFSGVTQCSGEQVDRQVVKPSDGCQKTAVGHAGGVIIENSDDSDVNNFAVFFSSDDCNPDKEIVHSDNGCQTPAYRSFAVWDVGSG